VVENVHWMSDVTEEGRSRLLNSVQLFRRFDYILLPIASVCVEASQRGAVDFDSFFTHTICHECCHGIGPHNIVTPDGRESTVRLVSLSSPFVYLLRGQVIACVQSFPADIPE
jgi:hypothetical protein